MLYVNLGVIALFIVLGIVFLSGRGAGLSRAIIPWPKRKRRSTTSGRCARFMGKLMLSLAACWAVSAAGLLLERMAFFWAGFAAVRRRNCFRAIYANTGGRYKR